MSDLVCPCCGRPVPAGEIQRQAPSPAAVASAIEVLAAHGRAMQMGAAFHHLIGVMRIEAAAGVAG